ncbi:hypothetical protein SAMN02745146_0093 [Hymenobacter daecheongensis DSM 21074]|uniref:Uncharacterized protein n=1 Tax=Hymenobacter daecheongensis DSM 21074 TaxID=1121955 RepID=A0A1M6LXR0_9BACT|nr:hypothetical protein [Hymenobacter daecheongensis]SHJ75930.1 hypothetical protein SAMN02745146_0093 [Hymenobacter daecheongensis DSM 21074]
MNLSSLSELQEQSKETFAAHPGTAKVFATADGNIFLNENAGRNHARQEKLELHTIERGEAQPAATEPANEVPAPVDTETPADETPSEASEVPAKKKTTKAAGN